MFNNLDSEQSKSKEIPSSKLVIVAEDDTLLGESLIDALRVLGCESKLVVNGEELIQAANLNKGNIGLIITDNIMPKMSGAEALSILTETHPEVPKILASAIGDNGLGRELEEKGLISGALHKPFEFDALEAVINKYLPAE